MFVICMLGAQVVEGGAVNIRFGDGLAGAGYRPGVIRGSLDVMDLALSRTSLTKDLEEGIPGILIVDDHQPGCQFV